MKLTPPSKVNRDTELFAKIQSKNKAWAKLEAKKQGFKSLAEFVDTLFDTLRKKKRG